VEVTRAVITSRLKRRQYNVLSNVTYSPSHRQAGAPTINIKSTLEKGFTLVLFGSNVNSYTLCYQSDMCVYTHVLHSIEKLVGQRK
jgi:hypothetical protein